MSHKIEELVDRSKEGLLSPKEIGWIEFALKSPGMEADRYALLYALGKSGAKEHRQTVESFLGDPDRQLGKLALQILCQFWGETSQYLECVCKALSDRSDEELLMLAASIAGEYLRDEQDPSMLRYLIEITESKDLDPSVITCAYQCLARSVGRDMRQVVQMALRQDWDPTVLEEAKRRLLAETA